MISSAEIDRLVRRVVATYQPEAVGLFGSYAIGTATDRSDLDLVIVKRTNEIPTRRASHVRHLLPTMYKLDIVVLTPEELAEAHIEPYSFHHTVVMQMKLLWVRPDTTLPFA